MKALIPFMFTLSACASPDVSALRAELAELREHVQKMNQPRLEAVDAMDDLAREVKKLREKTQSPPPPLAEPPIGPLPPPPPFQATAGRSRVLQSGVGGTQPGVNDHYWVLAKIDLEGADRTVLALYQTRGNGFRLQGVRLLNPDLQIIEYGQEKPHVKDIIDELRKKLR